MKVRSSISCIFLSILLILLLSMAFLTAEYIEKYIENIEDVSEEEKDYSIERFESENTNEYVEVKAEDILKQIQNGKDVYLKNCRIVGELNVSKIKLETVPNPKFYSLLDGGYNKEDITEFGIVENLSVIKSNISVEDSIFEKDLNFSNVLFNGSTEFYIVTFNNYAEFNGATFNNYVYFIETTFNNSAKFNEATFNNSADFGYATFNDYVHFYEVTFNDYIDFIDATFSNSAYFGDVTFNDYVHFGDATFNDYVYFDETTFNDYVYFGGAIFNNYVYFYEMTFNNSAYFEVPETSENIITDGKTCDFFRNWYKNEARYVDADNIYYNYRKYSQEKKNFTSISKWTDILSWITCGYGVRLTHTFYCIMGILLVFSFLYGVGLRYYPLSDIKVKKTWMSNLEPVLLSIRGFTTLGSGDWYSKNYFFRILITVEGLLGWIMLGIFMATLTSMMIRP